MTPAATRTPISARGFDAAGRLTLVELLDERVAQTPDAIALHSPAGTFTYAQWLSRAESVAAVLRDTAPAAAGQAVLVWVDTDDSRQFAAALHGALLCGAIAAPLDDRLSADEVRRYAADTAAVAAIVSRGLAARVSGELWPAGPILPGAVEWDLIAIPIDDGALRVTSAVVVPPRGPVDRVRSHVSAPGDCAFLAFTSGSTGRPKAAMITHGGSVQLAERMVNAVFANPRGGRPVGAGDVIQSPVPAYLGTSIANTLYPSAFAGCPMLYRGRRFDPAQSERDMAEMHTTIYSGAPAHYTMMCQQAPSDRAGDIAVDVIIASGSPMTRLLFEDMRLRWPTASVANWYALNETMVGQTLNWGQDMTADPTAVGRPIWPTQLQICDENGAPRPIGGEGEIWLRSPGQMTGYYRNEQATAERITDGWVRTGDLGRVDAGGVLTISGRLGSRINRGGFKFYPVEVEEVLARHPQVTDVGVIGVPHPTLGQDVVAFVALQNTAASVLGPDPAVALRDYCRRHLSRNKVPAEIRVLDELPRSGFGKLSRRSLLDLWQSGPAEQDLLR